MKIGYLCSDIEIPLFGQEGCSIHIREFTKALVQAGHDVFVLCSSLGKRANVTTRARTYQIEPRGLDATAWRLIKKEPLVENYHMARDLRSILYNHWLEGQGSLILEREQPDLLYERYSLFGPQASN